MFEKSEVTMYSISSKHKILKLGTNREDLEERKMFKYMDSNVSAESKIERELSLGLNYGARVEGGSGFLYRYGV